MTQHPGGRPDAPWVPSRAGGGPAGGQWAPAPEYPPEYGYPPDPRYGPGYPPGYDPAYPPGYDPGYPPGYDPGYPPAYDPAYPPVPAYDPRYAPSYAPPGYPPSAPAWDPAPSAWGDPPARDGHDHHPHDVPADETRTFTGAVPWNWRRDLTLTVAWLVLLWVTALWVHNGGVRTITSPATAVTALGRVTGMWSAALMLIQVVLMARVPFIERGIGQPHLVAVHRTLGIWSFSLMMAHLVAITAGYAELQPTQLWAMFWSTVLNAPGMVMAAGGTVCVLLVMLTSWRPMRRRLRYETWHLLHLYAYLGTFLALPHQLWTGREFTSSPQASAFWWALWGAAVTCVVVYRVGMPLWVSMATKLKVVDVQVDDRVDPPVVTVVVQGKQLERLRTEPGQYFVWRFRSGRGWTRGHPYSLVGAPTDTHLRIAVAVVGDGTSELRDLRPGTKVLVEGPYGRMHVGLRTSSRVTLIGAGIGITPLISILEGLRDEPGETTVIYRVSELGAAPLLAELTDAAAAAGAQLHVLEGRRVQGRSSWLPEEWGHVADAEAMRFLVPDVQLSDVFVCGGKPWAEQVVAAARECGVGADHLFVESFDG